LLEFLGKRLGWNSLLYNYYTTSNPICLSSILSKVDSKPAESSTIIIYLNNDDEGVGIVLHNMI